MAFMTVRGNAAEGPYRCPCCGFITLAERGAFEICNVCFWEDDGQDEHDASKVHGGPNHDLSLRQARQNFETIGACNEYRAQFVRDPLPEEHPDRSKPYGTGTLYSWP
ncbi:CPCC family cysteine-rich protein [Streptomyces collinus]|uniref:CPCC family cysteine-rich protein n=1 Tax=Streptomyces collinus TaxID=42684 RepID=UPI002943E786|nr:CPCC family cysteine-rich protein [Streptomyces collinus]